MNVPFIIAMIVAMLLLFVSMILAATAAADITDASLNDDKAALSSAYSFATWSAIASGISIFVLVVVLGLYIYFSWGSKKAASGTWANPIDVDEYKPEPKAEKRLLTPENPKWRRDPGAQDLKRRRDAMVL